MFHRRPAATPSAALPRGRGAALALAPIALMVLAACTGGPAPTPSVDATGVVSSGPLPPPSGDPGAPNPVTPEPVRDARKHAFTRAEAVPGGSAVRVEGLLTPGPPCAVIGRADVVETANQVTITLWVGPRPDADCDGPQKMTQFPFVIDVELREPLGGRTVIDGAR